MCKIFTAILCIHLTVLAWTCNAADTPVTAANQTHVTNQVQQKKQYPSVIIYTLSTCSHCMEAKQYMKENNIPFVNREVDLDEAHMTELMNIYESMGVPESKRGVPLLLIGSKSRLQGFNKDKFEAAIKEEINNKSNDK